MPRAKRTDRAEARRRYRASLGEQPEDEAAEPAAPASAVRAASPRPASAGERPSLGNAFRASFRPINLGEDLRYLPKLLIDRSVWLPILLTVAAGAAFAITSGSSWLVNLVATYFVAPPALGSVFLGGFLAPRASYLVGLIVGLVSAVVATVIILTSPASLMTGQPLGTTPTPTPVASIAASPSASAGPAASGSPVASPAPSASASVAPGASASAAPEASPTPSSTPTTNPSSLQDQIVYAFVTSPPFGMFFAAAAAWYRRFLRLSRPIPPRSQQGRRGDGRTRTRR